MTTPTPSPDLVAQVAAELRKQATPQPPPSSTPPTEPWRVKIAGQELQFNDPNTLQAQLDAQQAAFDARLAEATRAAQQPQPEPPAPESPAPPADGVNPAFKKFAEALVNDPSAAIVEALEAKFGPKFFEIVGQSAVKTAEMAQNIAVDQFMRTHEDYDPRQAQNAEVLEKILKANNMPVTAQSLDLAWGYAKSAGLAQTAQAQPPANPYQMPSQRQAYPQQPAPSSSPFAPPPPPHPGRSMGGGDDVNAVMSQVHLLDKGTLAKLIQQHSQFNG